ncbi:MAG TPA: hypothetical protein VFN29_06215 [Chiayiivirga sp.]|nr:hypothetical protein [Chiayiivirga sp.]
MVFTPQSPLREAMPRSSTEGYQRQRNATKPRVRSPKDQSGVQAAVQSGKKSLKEHLIKADRCHCEIPFPFRKCPRAMNLPPTRHGEARRAVAIHKFGAKTLDRFATLAMTNQQRIAWVHGERSEAIHVFDLSNTHG